MNKTKPWMREIEHLPDDVHQAAIEATATRLAHYHYSPMLSVDAPDFLHYTKETLKERCLQIGSDDQGAHVPPKDAAIALLIKQYKLLQQLRCDDPEAWALIEELYGEE